MSVTESERYHLYEVLKDRLGAAPADTLMNLIPPTNWSDLATGSDVESSRVALRSEIVELRAEMSSEFASVRGEMAAEFASVRGEMAAEFASVRGEMAAEFATVRTEISESSAALQAGLTRTFGTWLFASQAAMIAAVTLIVSVRG